MSGNPTKDALGIRFPALSAALVALILAACGGGKPQGPDKAQELAEKHERERAKRKQAREAASRPVPIELDSERWDYIRPYFERYAAQKVTQPRNLFEPRVLAMIPRPPEVVEEAEATEAAEVAEVEEVPTEPPGPLQQYPLKDYKLVMIMSGTAIPKARVVDPKGQVFDIRRNTLIGNKGGVVRAITQYEVRVEEPDAEEPHVMSIRPDIFDLNERDELDSDELESAGGRRDSVRIPEPVIPGMPRHLK